MRGLIEGKAVQKGGREAEEEHCNVRRPTARIREK